MTWPVNKLGYVENWKWNSNLERQKWKTSHCWPKHQNCLRRWEAAKGLLFLVQNLIKTIRFQRIGIAIQTFTKIGLVKLSAWNQNPKADCIGLLNSSDDACYVLIITVLRVRLICLFVASRYNMIQRLELKETIEYASSYTGWMLFHWIGRNACISLALYSMERNEIRNRLMPEDCKFESYTWIFLIW